MTADDSGAEALRASANELLDAQLLEQAVEVLTALIELDPDDAWGHRVRGVVRSVLGDIAGAVADLDRSVHLAPDEAAGWARRAELRASSSDLAAAAADVERALELDPESVVALTVRATIRRHREDLAGAEADLTRALELEPDSAWVLTARAAVRDDVGDLAGALADVGRALGVDPSSAHAWALQGHLAVRAGDNDMAVESASRAIALDPESGWAYGNRGLAREELGDLEGALADLTRATDLRAEDGASWMHRGRLLLGSGDAPGAIAAIDRAIELGGDDAYTYALRAKARWLAREFEGLLDRMSQDPPRLQDLLALAFGGAAVSEAMADLRRASELDSEVAASVFGLGQVDDLRRLLDTMRLLTEQRPGDLDETVAAVSRAMRSTDATERLAELLTLELVLEGRAADGIEGADVAHAATLDLALSAIDDLLRQGTAVDADLGVLRARMESARAGLPDRAAFKSEVDAMKARLGGTPPERPGA